MRSHRWSCVVALCLAASSVVSCGAPDEGRSAEIPAPFLRERLQRVRGAVDRARSEVAEDPAAAAETLRQASIRLRALDEYFLAILEARQQVETAAAGAASGGERAAFAVDSAESILLGMVRGHGEHLAGELREPLERLEDAREALEVGDPEEARTVLRQLADHLESIFFRGDLVLEGSVLDPSGGRDGR